MWDRWPRRWALLSALSAMSTRRAEAADPTPAIRVEYRAARECPDRSAFLANVGEKAAFTLTDDAEAASRTFTVTLGPNEPDVAARGSATSAYRGVLRVRPRGAPVSTREVGGVDCAEVTEAIAVIIAIELGPDNRDDIEPRPAPREPPLEPSPPRPPPWRFGLAASAGATSALSDGVSLAVRLPLVLRRQAPTVWAPELRLGPMMALGETIENNGGSLKLRLFGAALEVCPLRVELGQRLSLEPCAISVLALRVASGGPPSEPSAQTRSGFWADVGGAGRARVAVSNSIWVDISAEGFIPLVRDRFHTFSQNIAVFEVPGAGVRAAAAVGAFF